MGLPSAKEARPYYRSAQQRVEDAQFLFAAGRTTGAMYLAGYGVECMLKALILTQIPAGSRGDMLLHFRGARAHNFDWLKAKYYENRGPVFPSRLSKALTLVSSWDTSLRYESKAAKTFDAKRFLQSVNELLQGINERM